MSIRTNTITFSLGSPPKPETGPPPPASMPSATPPPRRLSTHLSNYTKKKMISIKATKRILAPYVKARRRPKEAAPENKTFSFYLQKKPSILMKEMSQWSLALNVLAVMTETAAILAESTDSKVANVYMVDELLDEIYMLTESYDEASGVRKERRVSYKIGTETTLAAHVASTKDIIKIDDLLEDIRFPDGIGNLEVTVKAVICVPVITPDGDCLAVFELYRDIDGEAYDENDLYLVVLMSTWVGSTIHQNQMQLTLQKQHKLTEYLQQLAVCYFDDATLLDKLIAEIVNFAKVALDAEHGLFYVFRSNVGELVADEYEDRDSIEHLIKRKNMPIGSFEDNDIITVISQAEGIMNIKNCGNDPRVRRQQKKRYYRIRAILAAPIKLNNQVLGLIQILNKKDVPFFSKSDEVLMKTFSEYCALILKFAHRSDMIKKENNLNDAYEHMLGSHMKPCIHDTLFLLSHMEVPFVPQSLDNFNYCLPDSLETYAPQYIMYMLNKIVDDTFESPDKCALFVLTVKQAFRERPYFNFRRAFHVCHCMYNLLFRTCFFTPIEAKALLIAAYSHGIDYNGQSSTYLELTSSSLSLLYEGAAMIENHYYYILSIMIQTTGVFTHMEADDYKDLMEEIKQCLLATYGPTLLKRRTKLLKLHSDKAFNPSIDEHRLYLKSVMMGVAVFSDFCKPYNKASMRLVHDLYKEYYMQGDLIKKMGFIPVTTYDRDKAIDMEKDQSSFMTAVVLPNTVILANFIPSVDQLVEEAKYGLKHERAWQHRSNINVRNAWDEVVSTQGQKLWTVDESLHYGRK